MSSKNLTHVDAKGKISMVDVGEKEVTQRLATAQGVITGNPKTIEMIVENQHKKGDVLTCAHLAGIMGAKKTSDLIPLCHPLDLSSVKLELIPGNDHVKVLCTAKTSGRTGVEMEALTGASVACLTIYDMCKAVDREMCIGEIKLLKKSGGKSGDFEAKSN